MSSLGNRKAAFFVYSKFLSSAAQSVVKLTGTLRESALNKLLFCGFSGVTGTRPWEVSEQYKQLF